MSQPLPETAPPNKGAIVINIGSTRLMITRQTTGKDGRADQHRLVFGRPEDEKLPGEPPPKVQLSPTDTAAWWSELRRFAKGTDDFPARISVALV